MATRSRRTTAQNAPQQPARARRNTTATSTVPGDLMPVGTVPETPPMPASPLSVDAMAQQARPADGVLPLGASMPLSGAPRTAARPNGSPANGGAETAPQAARPAVAPQASAMPQPPAPAASSSPASPFPAVQTPAAAFPAMQMPAMQVPALPFGFLDPVRLAEIQREYFERWQRIVTGAVRREPPAIGDKRFSDPSWQEGLNAINASLYLLNADAMMRLADSVQGDPKLRDRIRFAMQQWVEAMSPANFLATNPEAQKKLVETKGESLRVGLENLVADMQRGRISQTDESAFEVGRNVATSPGAVIFQNELIQIIQYAPSTPQVGSRPLLMVPPCINKFYILDLQPDNSFVAHAVARGHTVFMLSWRNAGAELANFGWDDYLERGVFEAIRVVREVSGEERLNLLGFCVGGTILCSALAALEARGENVVESLTLLTTLLDFADPGVLGVFIDEAFVALREQQYASGGILPGKDLATTFSFLRPNDLVWNYVVSNYLKGERPTAFDLLYWNADSTNLPGPMYCWYLRHMYLQNELKIPDRLTCAGQPVDLRRIKAPAYVFGAREDHIVPWQAAHASTTLLGGPTRYVLGASGHIAGTINSPKKNRRSYWTRDGVEADPERWLAGAPERPGSWWTDWADWLDGFKGDLIPAPPVGAPEYPPLEQAPGSYVKQRAG